MSKTVLRAIILFIAFSSFVSATPRKFLFDAAHYQTAGNADWVIDEDNHVAARYPTPLQSTITSSTPETYWTGAVSSWGIKLVQLGHTVETLPAGTTITYGTSAAQDLQNYDVFIVDEPNSPFTSAERNALMNFVHNGGGLFIISDHNNADRNNDGWDALAVWNDLMRHSSAGNLPFGFKFDSVDVSPSSTNIAAAWSSDPVLNGPQGAVSQLIFHNGATITMYQTINPTVKGLIWTTGVSQGSTGLLCVSSTYGTGRIFAIGDSSPADDGTGSSGHTLYSSWLGEANGNHAKLHLNASLWLAKLTGVTQVNENGITPVKFSLEQNFPNPFNPVTSISYSIPKNEFVQIAVYDELGREVARVINEQQTTGTYKVDFNANDLSSGVYYYRLTAGEFTDTKKMMVIK
ncbi:MAG: T9SS type A sorting domain-containing protein [Bacteroidetes bacterium]|nr:T9SS type A sorting domain-containing protein [Bacteroidota bacterium]